MKKTTSDVLAKKAKSEGYAVPALNSNGGTYDIVRAIIEVASEMRSPLIIQAYEPNLEYRGYKNFVDLVHQLGEDADIPISIQLDHGKSEKSILNAIKAGFTTVMIDYANLPFEENVEGTKRVISIAHDLNVAVEGEIGHIIISSKEDVARTKGVDSVTALAYAKAARPDLMAVALGTTHGIFDIQESIDFEVLKRVSENTDIPLVLHGTCGIPMELIERCAKSGISKINFGENIRIAYINHMRDVLDGFPHNYHPWRAMHEVKDRLKKDIRKMVEACGSAGKV